MAPRKQCTHNDLRAAGPIAFLAGVWFFVSPWFYDSYALDSAWNNWIVGAAVVVLAAFRLGYPFAAWIGWVNCLLGIWIFASPWIYGYNVDHRRLVNSLCVSVAIFFVVGLHNGIRPPPTSHPNRQISTHS